MARADMVPHGVSRARSRGYGCLLIVLFLIDGTSTAQGAASPPGKAIVRLERPEVGTARRRSRIWLSGFSELPPHRPTGTAMGMAISTWSIGNNRLIAAPAAPPRQPIDLHWESAPDWLNNAPEWLRNAPHSRRRGLPLVHLWNSSRFLLALGFNEHGVPGIYLTQSLMH
jgi:hypothetical protein